MTRRTQNRQSGISLVELLVAMMIMGILTTMIIGSWVALSKSYANTSKSSRQRDFATQAISRMAREIRDAQKSPTETATAFVRTYPNEVRFYSTFNKVNAEDPTTPPRLTRFILKETDAATHIGTIYRQLAGDDGLFETNDPNESSLPVVSNVVNLRTGDDLFTYHAIDAATGNMYASEGMSTLVLADRVQTVSILLQVDLNPGRSPNYMDIGTTVEPRNVRHM